MTFIKVVYARLSRIDRSQETGLDTQIKILKRQGVESIFSESQSGSSIDERLKLKSA